MKLDAIRRLITTGTTDFFPKPKKSDTGMDHVRVLIERGYLTISAERAFVMRAFEQITATQTGTHLMARLRRIIARTGIPFTIRIGDDDTYTFDTNEITLQMDPTQFYLRSTTRNGIEIERFTTHGALVHELIHLLHHLECPINYLFRINHASNDPENAFEDLEEQTTITGHAYGPLGGYLGYDAVNENAYLKECRLTIRSDHYSHTREAIVLNLCHWLTHADTMEQLLYALELLQGVLNAKIADYEDLAEIRLASRKNLTFIEAPYLANSLFDAAGVRPAFITH